MNLPFRWTYRTTILGLCMAVYFASRIGQVALSTLAPEITTSFGITMTLFGVAFTGLSTTSALAQLPSGVLSDRYGERALILGAVILTCTSTLLLAFAPTYLVFLPVMVVVGIGSGLYYTPSTAILDDCYDQIGRAIGIYRISGQAAGVAAPVLVGLIGVYYGWRATLFAAGILLVPVLAGVLIFMRPTPPNDPETAFRTRVSARRLLELLSRPGLGSTAVLASSIQFVEVASFTFLPAILRQYHGLSTATAGTVFALYFAVVTLLQPVSGWLSDHVGRDFVTGILLTSGVIGYGLLAQRVAVRLLLGAVFCIGVAMTWGAPVQSRFMDALGDAERGVGFGLVRTIYLLIGALGSYVTGTLVTEAGWSTAFGTLAGLLGCCLIWLLVDAFGFPVGSNSAR